MKTVLIISGGTLDEALLLHKYNELEEPAVIACEHGAAFCLANGIPVALAAGDFDTEGAGTVERLREAEIPLLIFPSHKNETDTEIALTEALKMEPDRIVITGATGTRLDHMLANIRLLARAAGYGHETANESAVPSGKKQKRPEITIEDPYNILSVHTQPFTVRHDPALPYISFYAFSEEVRGLTLKGFAYPVRDFVLRNTDSVGTSNELEEEEGTVSFESGVLVAVRSSDG